MGIKKYQDRIIYQIYPKSFRDSNGDGIGDLRGIIGKLEYLKDLGVNTIWLNPIFVSPQIDNGYDVSNYYALDEKMGTLHDFDEFVESGMVGNLWQCCLLRRNFGFRHESYFGQASMVQRCNRKRAQPLSRLLFVGKGKRRQIAEQLGLIFWRQRLGKRSASRRRLLLSLI